ncbi:hypothetical protein GH714_007765 [Hevea brasiliensis]|uniref:AAA+ ATPase domain-containing protein n=1 Tax=Hevea brasiliensis TaxID=3981 RepID=A0A6A6L1S4_HEVBR|nr:hypothetical protein GH714_007765 [Hevea brasiliensis]
MTSLEMETSDINSVQTHTPKEDVDDAVFLSWKDLWVTVRDGRHGSRSILQGLTAYAQPGELLAIMGPSGCGKSTLLDALAGRLNSNTIQAGEVLINGHKQALAYGTTDLEQGMSDATPTEEVINTLIQSYTSSETYQEVRKKVAEINKEKSFVNMYRDIGYYRLRLFVYVGLAFGLATIYYDLGSSYGSIQARGSLLMFISTFLTFMAIGGFPSFVEEMKPFLLVISLIPGAIAYYLTGLQKGFDHFLCFASIIFASMILVESVMMVVASIVPNFLMGIIAGAGIQGLMILGGGFFRLPNDLPKPFWKYPLYYIAFHKYAYQGMFKNEFEGLKLQSNQAAGGIPRMINGEEILRDMASGNGLFQMG